MHETTLPIGTPLTRDFIHGAVDIEPTAAGLLPHRLPAWARAQCPDAQLAMAESQPSGVRVVFQTAATAVELGVLATKRVYGGLGPRPDGIYDLFIGGELAQQGSVQGGRTLHIAMPSGAATVTEGEAQTLRFSGLPPEQKTIEIWLPHDEVTELVSLRSDAPLSPVPAAGRRRWVHHGSSISQGSNTTHPSGTWPAVAALRTGFELLNLGYGGNALLDPFVARTIRELPADLISVKIGINLVNKDLMRLRAFGPAVHGFLDTIREGHPDTPLLVVSPIFCPIHEILPGPSVYDLDVLAEGRLLFKAGGSADEVLQGKLTLGVIREQLRAIVEQRRAADINIHYVDGLELYGPNDNLRLPLPDELHPDAASHRLIGERFAGLIP
jgi:lysophospholipase L1-like esterase